jgi:hypothetical protein
MSGQLRSPCCNRRRRPEPLGFWGWLFATALFVAALWATKPAGWLLFKLLTLLGYYR